MAKKRLLKKKSKMLEEKVIVDEKKMVEKPIQEEKPVQPIKKEKAVKESTAVSKPKKGTFKKADIYVQFGGKEYSQQEIIAQIKKTWKEEGNLISDINTLDVYIKPEENRVYYSINGEWNASISL